MMARANLAFGRSFDFYYSYNITRRYPFKRFRWIATALMVLLFCFFTVFNLATSGYDLQPLTSLEPNQTEAERSWFNNEFFTWGNQNLNPKCQPVEISIGTQFMTSNQGSIHTISSITGPCGPQGAGQNNRISSCPSLSYHAQNLSNCQVTSITIPLRKADLSEPGTGYWWSWSFSSASAQSVCNVVNDQGAFTVAMNTPYSGTTKSFNILAVDNFNKSGSLWWGARIMDVYFNGLEVMMATGLNGSIDLYDPANGQLTFNAVSNSTIRGHSMFNASFFFFDANGGILNDANSYTDNDQLFNNETFRMSRALTEGLFFSKAFYSLVLVDLGQTQGANLLLDSSSLQYALNPDDDFNRQPGAPAYQYNLSGSAYFDWWRMYGITPPGQIPSYYNSVLMSDAYDTFPKTLLGTQPATMYFQYTCSVPKIKSIAAVLLLVLVSDIVFLSATWTILKFFTDRWLVASDPTAMYCDGCRALSHRSDDMPLLPVSVSKPVSARTIGDGFNGAKYHSLREDDIQLQSTSYPSPYQSPYSQYEFH